MVSHETNMGRRIKEDSKVHGARRRNQVARRFRFEGNPEPTVEANEPQRMESLLTTPFSTEPTVEQIRDSEPEKAFEAEEDEREAESNGLSPI